MKLVTIILIFFAISCIPAPQTRISVDQEEVAKKPGSDDLPLDANGATGDDETTVPANCDEYPDQQGCPNYNKGLPELTFLVDPFDGSYQSKISIPRNFTGMMYIGGVNLTSLTSKLVHVRFNFGLGLEPVTIPAMVGRGSGMTPQTNAEVLVLNITDQPFYNIRLLYQLFDYNDYDIDSNNDHDGNEQEEPVTTPRDGNLFCRGLKVEYDPTFAPTGANPNCNYDGAVCKYAYANIRDSGLYYDSDGDGDIDSNDIAYEPSEAQIDLLGGGYATLSASDAVKKCLPDSNNLSTLNAVLGLSLVTPPSYGADIGLGVYKGPYFAVDESNWQISGAAMFTDVNGSAESGTGLFQEQYVSIVDPNNPNRGYKSFLFPRAGSISLGTGIQYIGTSTGAPPFDDAKGIESLSSSGDTTYIDGCNIRVNGYNPATNDSISSCNVAATIEVVEINPITQATTVITSSKKVKLQLISSSAESVGQDGLQYTPVKSCETSRSCGGDECCFNGRCWSKDLVSQCREDAANAGMLSTGQVCDSDFQCASLCCDTTRKVCSVHVNTEVEQVLCQKAPGQQCVSKEYCRQENVPHCNIYKTGVDNQGNQLCQRRCFTIPTYGNCVNGVCVVPRAPDVPDFDPDTYDCNTALEYPADGIAI